MEFKWRNWLRRPLRFCIFTLCFGALLSWLIIARQLELTDWFFERQFVGAPSGVSQGKWRYEMQNVRRHPEWSTAMQSAANAQDHVELNWELYVPKRYVFNTDTGQTKVEGAAVKDPLPTGSLRSASPARRSLKEAKDEPDRSVKQLLDHVDATLAAVNSAAGDGDDEDDEEADHTQSSGALDHSGSADEDDDTPDGHRTDDSEPEQEDEASEGNTGDGDDSSEDNESESEGDNGDDDEVEGDGAKDEGKATAKHLRDALSALDDRLVQQHQRHNSASNVGHSRRVVRSRTTDGSVGDRALEQEGAWRGGSDDDISENRYQSDAFLIAELPWSQSAEEQLWTLARLASFALWSNRTLVLPHFLIPERNMNVSDATAVGPTEEDEEDDADTDTDTEMEIALQSLEREAEGVGAPAEQKGDVDGGSDSAEYTEADVVSSLGEDGQDLGGWTPVGPSVAAAILHDEEAEFSLGSDASHGVLTASDRQETKEDMRKLEELDQQREAEADRLESATEAREKLEDEAKLQDIEKERLRIEAKLKAITDRHDLREQAAELEGQRLQQEEEEDALAGLADATSEATRAAPTRRRLMSRSQLSPRLSAHELEFCRDAKELKRFVACGDIVDVHSWSDMGVRMVSMTSFVKRLKPSDVSIVRIGTWFDPASAMPGTGSYPASACEGIIDRTISQHVHLLTNVPQGAQLHEFGEHCRICFAREHKVLLVDGFPQVKVPPAHLTLLRSAMLTADRIDSPAKALLDSAFPEQFIALHLPRHGRVASVCRSGSLRGIKDVHGHVRPRTDLNCLPTLTDVLTMVTSLCHRLKIYFVYLSTDASDAEIAVLKAQLPVVLAPLSARYILRGDYSKQDSEAGQDPLSMHLWEQSILAHAPYFMGNVFSHRSGAVLAERRRIGLPDTTTYWMGG